MTTNNRTTDRSSAASASALPVGTAILDEALADIAAALTTHAPERGGALFGPRAQKMVTLFVPDDDAEHHHVTYTPSPALSMKVPRIEQTTGLEYKGIVHSHPGGLDRPSMPDVAAARRALRANVHLPAFLMPIVTLGDFRKEDLAAHETVLPGGKISHFLVSAQVRRGTSQLRPERLSSLSLYGDLRALSALLPGSPEVPKGVLMDMEGVMGVAYTLDILERQWLFIATPGYPFTPPLVADPDAARPVPLSWNLSTPAEHRLLEAFSRLGLVETPRENHLKFFRNPAA